MNKILKERSNKKKKSAAEIDKLDGAQRLDGPRNSDDGPVKFLPREKWWG